MYPRRFRNRRNSFPYGFGMNCPYMDDSYGSGWNLRPRGRGYSSMCVCPECGLIAEHPRGIPCSSYQCPECGSEMAGYYCL